MKRLPGWREKAEKRRLDLLGMQNSGTVLYQSMLPNIRNVTLRMRYYGYHCWVSGAYARDGASTDFELWRTWSKAEPLYALVLARASKGGAGHMQWTNRGLPAAGEVSDLASPAARTVA